MTAAIVLLGPPGAGKTTCGLLAARELGLAFIDLDANIAVLGGAPASTLYARDVDAFRALELRALAQSLRRSLAEPALIAAGGGVVESRRARALLARVPCVLLAAPASVAFSRLQAAPDARPWLTTLAAYLAREQPRLPLRRGLARAVVDGGADVAHVVPHLVRALREIRTSS